MTDNIKGVSSILITRITVDKEELVCIAPWYWEEINKTMEYLSTEAEQLRKERDGLLGEVDRLRLIIINLEDMIPDRR